MPVQPRLREQYATFGPTQLGPVELLALVIGTGTTGLSAREIASRLLDQHGSLSELRLAPVSALSTVKGMGPARAVRVHAALQLSVRALQSDERPCIDQPRALVEFLMPRLATEPVETFWMVGLDHRLRVMDCQLISRGSRRCTVVDPSEVFRHAVASRMSSIVVAHNHPSGDPRPSNEDRALTRRLVQCGQLLGVPLVDHIVIGRNSHWSFQENGALPHASEGPRLIGGVQSGGVNSKALRPPSLC